MSEPPSELILRPIDSTDESFLFALFCSAHQHQLGPAELPAEQQNHLLRIQYESQRQEFTESFPNTEFNLILNDGKPVGQLFINRQPDQFFIVDIAFLPEHRRKGIGTLLIVSLLQEAQRRRVPVRAHVLKVNPAWEFWKGLGFQIVGQDEVYSTIEFPVSALRND